MTGDILAEDPLCTHVPGTFRIADLTTAPPAVVYGAAEARALVWDDDARERMKRIPAFVRGMVVRAVESHCKDAGIARVTVEELDRIRARMPTPKIFGGA